MDGWRRGTNLDADVVLHAGTGVVFEPFMQDKITVFPRYLTCNTLLSEQYDAGWNLRNRDGLRELCNLTVRSLGEARERYAREHGRANEKFIADFVQGNSDSVAENMARAFERISQGAAGS